MKVLKSERTIYVDVDDTLVMHSFNYHKHEFEMVAIDDPVHPGSYIQLRKNLNMIRLVREESQRGSTIIVWSRGGWQWANNVVEALELEEYVYMVMSKPLTYLDDSPVENWLKDRVYIGPDETYKSIKN